MIENKKSGAVDPQIKTGLHQPLPGIRDVFATILETVTAGIASSAKGTGLTGAPLLEAVTEVATSAVRGAVSMGSDLVPASKAILMGIVRGTEARDETAIKILSHTSRIVIHQTADRGGDLAAATKGLVLGAIASARSTGMDIAKAASMAAQGAYEGAAEAGSVTVERVLAALKEPIGGSKVALPEPLAR
jgi:hypothetical protein